ncbi:tetraacyldisaccharide 4'-kinase [Zoogloea sp.]|uniref:tetraacyldisaccharide 4'-kinase n=1 Tax=Zoogloea sp. TaxID=49181 RepID=UPI00321FA9D2
MPRSAPGFWRHRGVAALALLPLSLVFSLLADARRQLYRCGLLRIERLPVPVVVVGNIAVGGSGKTPVALWLAAELRSRGRVPGIVSRGYGGQVEGVAEVMPGADPVRFGDEPVLMAALSGCPVFVGRDRPAAARSLLEAHSGVDVLIADDGLQHYRLGRDVEVVVVDEATLGNRLRLPAGPLRESVTRIAQSSVALAHGRLSHRLREALADVPVFEFTLAGDVFERVGDRSERCGPAAFKGRRVIAMAGIGRPERFFAQLEAMGITLDERRPLPDHHAYLAADVRIGGGDVLLMTEKDAVKCAAFAPANSWVLPVRARMEPGAAELIVEKLDGPPTA